MSEKFTHLEGEGELTAEQVPLVEKRELEDSRDILIQRMQEVAAPHQDTLTEAETVELRRLTKRLLVVERDKAVAEYERFNQVKSRELDIDKSKLRERLEGKIVLVTGGTGCIGSELLTQLKEYNPAKIVSVSRGLTRSYPEIPEIQYETLDIRDKDGIVSLFTSVKPDLVYHLAAQRDPGLAEREVGRTLSTNITGTSNIIEASKYVGTPQLVYASTGKALRPFTSDTYAASKKVSEVMMAEAAGRGELLASGVRFTHVVDNSIIHQRLLDWVKNDEPIRLHGPQLYFYLQSAKESANLLLNAGMDVREGVYDIHAIRNLDLPADLVDLALGAIEEAKSDTAIYFAGFEPGYEKEVYPGLYDPKYSGRVSPLINSLEAMQASTSETCHQVDRVPFAVIPNEGFHQSLHAVETAAAQNTSSEDLRVLQNSLSWSMLEVRLKGLPTESIKHLADRMRKESLRRKFSEEHARINEVLYQELLSRQ